MTAPKQTDPQFKLRLTPDVKAKIERAANDSGRSMNAEILWRLERSFMSGTECPSEDMTDSNHTILQRLSMLEAEIASTREEDKRFREEIMGWIKRTRQIAPEVKDGE